MQLAQDQGHLTVGDINDALPRDLVTPEKLEEILKKLKSLEVEIVEQLDAAPRQKPTESAAEAEKTRLLKYAYDEGDPVSRIIRKALEKALPEIFKNGK